MADRKSPSHAETLAQALQRPREFRVRLTPGSDGQVYVAVEETDLWRRQTAVSDPHLAASLAAACIEDLHGDIVDRETGDVPETFGIFAPENDRVPVSRPAPALWGLIDAASRPMRVRAALRTRLQLIRTDGIVSVLEIQADQGPLLAVENERLLEDFLIGAGLVIDGDLDSGVVYAIASGLTVADLVIVQLAQPMRIAKEEP
ncbi:hypothetical protein [Azospirillum brasilense]|uniref:Uncharacterized protein n=1 Tax=Azospirillum brasilense TaxID=192 RepID=A0A6L3AR96_AZOBR|nr:hypothetical protein [Azospirillum brasilense]KAA0676742.1 hypothetical protein DS837_30395 [Azospirillum brasilense]